MPAAAVPQCTGCSCPRYVYPDALLCPPAPLQERAGPGGDLLPGLQALALTWLREAALASFRETAEGAEGGGAAAVTLSGWFDASAVKMHLQVGCWAVLPLLAAATWSPACVCVLHALLQCARCLLAGAGAHAVW
jgi:hypothetical protein